MDKRTLTALRGSIKKWEGIVAGKARDNGPDNCPLCKEFFDDDCIGCPVREATGFECCYDTPHYSWCEAHYEAERDSYGSRIHADDSAIAAVLELEFLRSLLPSRRK